MKGILHPEDERYVRAFQRDTIGWLKLHWIAQGLYWNVRRKANTAGVILLEDSVDEIATVLGHPGAWGEMESHFNALVTARWLEIARVPEGLAVVVTNYVATEEAQASSAARKRRQRERERDRAALPDGVDAVVTLGSHAVVTPGSHAVVTPGSHAVVTPSLPPSLRPSDPYHPSPPTPPPGDGCEPGGGAGELDPPEGDPVAVTRTKLLRMPPPLQWLPEQRAEERLASGCLGGQTRLADVLAGIDSAALMLGDLGNVLRDDRDGMRKLERFVARFVGDQPRRRLAKAPSMPQDAPGDPEAGGAFLELFVERYAGAQRGYGPYPVAVGDLAHMATVVQYARAQAAREAAPDPEARAQAIVAHVIGSYLADPFYATRGHSIVALAKAVATEPARFGLPPAPSSRKAPAAPALVPGTGVRCPPHLRGKLEQALARAGAASAESAEPEHAESVTAGGAG